MDGKLVVYKFLSLSDEERIQRAARLFQESAIYFANASQFNDPFDCKFNISTEASTEQWREYITKTLTRNGIAPESVDLDRFAITMRNEFAPTQEQIDAAVLQTKDSVRVLSLSKRCDHILMWSHYADCHKGICLELTFWPGTMFYDNAREVRYDGPLPSLNFFGMLNGSVQDESWLLRKHKDWEYEQEIRVIGPPSQTGMFKIPDGALTRVILGSRIGGNNRRSVLSWVADGSCAIRPFEAREKPREYGLDVLPIDTNNVR